MRRFITKNNLRDMFSDITNEGLIEGLKLLRKHNKPVAQYLLQGDGLKFHRMDSDIANNILMCFLRLKEPVLALCVHDSFIVARKYAEQLEWAMNKFYWLKVRKHPKIK